MFYSTEKFLPFESPKCWTVLLYNRKFGGLLNHKEMTDSFQVLYSIRTLDGSEIRPATVEVGS